MLRPLYFVAAALIAVFSCPAAYADVELAGSKIVFATAEQAAGLLNQRDEYVERLSPFDRSARMRSAAEVTEAQFLKFIAAAALDWPDEQREKLEAVIAAVAPQVVALDPPLPETIYLVHTSGDEEGDAFYTRGAAIIVPRSKLDSDSEYLQRIFAHELFHVISRHALGLRNDLYAAIGFQPCGEVELPGELAERKITNPDAPRIEHCIQLTIEGRQRWAMPVLYSRSQQYDPRGGSFFNYLQFRLMVVERDEQGQATPALNHGEPILLEPTEVDGLFEQIGRNTQYIIHPEEVLADNFAMLVMRDREVESPEILQKMQRVLQQHATAALR